MKQYEVNVFEVVETFVINAKSKAEAIKKAMEKHGNEPTHDCNEPARFEIAE